jgi:acetyl esterase/lipase
MTLDPGAARLLRMLAAAGAGGAAAEGPAERRRRLQTLARIAGERGPASVDTRDLQATGPGGPLRLRLYAPAADGPALPRPALVYFHGGGWVAGDLDTHDGLCRRLAASSGVRLLAVDYRLAPEHPFPAALDDALFAVRWAAANAQALDLDPGRLGVAGDSAGGGLAAAVAQNPAAPPLALQLLLCPILDPAAERPSRHAFGEGHFVERAALAEDLGAYCGDAVDPRDPRVSPLRARDLAGQPPALVHVAECDPFRDEGEAYAERLALAGVAVHCVCWPGMVHYFYALAQGVPAAGPAVDAIGAEIARAMRTGAVVD